MNLVKRISSQRLLLWYYCGLLSIALIAATIALQFWSQNQASGQGTLLLVASAKGPEQLSIPSIAIHSASGWHQLRGKLESSIKPAPNLTTLTHVTLPSGNYDSLQLGNDRLAASVSIHSNQVEPVLVSFANGHPLPSGVYAGGEQLNLGLNELSGQLHQLPTFTLRDQENQPFNNQTMLGKTWVIAAFHTTCQETCPLYTGLFFQLQKQLPASVQLAEITTDPDQDTPSVLQDYASRVGINWHLLTGEKAQLESFWNPMGVGLSNQQLHASALEIVDSHGYLRSVYQGIPNVNNSLPSALSAELNSEGKRELNSHGDGWGLSQVIDTLNDVAKADEAIEARSGKTGIAPTFAAPDFEGKTHSLSELQGHPIVLNYFASWCSSCEKELPLLKATITKYPQLRVVLVDERDNNEAAKKFLKQLGGIPSLTLQDPNGIIGSKYQVGGLPITFFIRPDGSISSRHAGVMDQATLKNHLTDLGVN